MERDSDKDGKIDQVVHFDNNGQLTKLEVDDNGDEVMDRFQFYEDGQIKRLERDTDYDSQIDAWDDFAAGKRVQHRRISIVTGKVELLVAFDDQERPLKMHRDTTADGRLDEVYISLRAQREETPGAVDRRLQEKELAELDARLAEAGLPAEEAEDRRESLLARYAGLRPEAGDTHPGETAELAEAVSRHDRLAILGDAGEKTKMPQTSRQRN